MGEDAADRVREVVDAVYRSDSRRVLATLIRLLGDFDLAEEALHDAFTAAVKQWPRAGVPANPKAWLVSAGRFKAIDALRRRARFDASLSALAERLHAESADPPQPEDEDVEDDRLRLIFVCCHPALPADARVALTLREVCGLTTEEIARAFLASPPTVAQRIVRAKSKIRDAGIPYQIPARKNLPDRLDAVLHVIYLVFNEGYSASSGESLIRHDLSSEAIRLGRLLVELLPEPEAIGLLALMLLHDARRPARTSVAGELVLLDEQDRSLWNRDQIAEGASLLKRALSSRRIGPFALQAAIAAVHGEASDAAATDWAQIVGLYDVLMRVDPSPVIELNRAAAVAMRDGPKAGLELVDAILARGDLGEYHLAHSARADLCRRLEMTEEACASYRRALELTRQEPERRFLERRLDELAKRASLALVDPPTSADERVRRVAEAYDRAAEKYAAARAPVTGSFHRLLDRLVEPLPAGASVLDVGCGHGVPARYLVDRGFRVTGVDASARLLEAAKKAVPEATFLLGDMRSADPGGPFDAVLAWDSVFHLPREDHAAVFARFRSWLEPCGRLLVSLGGSGGDDFTSEMLGETFFYSGHAPETSIELLEGTGFRIEHWEVDDPSSRGHIAILGNAGPLPGHSP